MQLDCLNKFKSAHDDIVSGLASRFIIALPITKQDKSMLKLGRGLSCSTGTGAYGSAYSGQL